MNREQVFGNHEQKRNTDCRKKYSVVDKAPYCYLYLIRFLESVLPLAEVVDDHHDDDNELSVCYSGLISATNSIL